jgi:hypothetical protein
MTNRNPFPGMNPFLERHWSDVHTKLIAYMADALGEALPGDLNARSEERVTLHDYTEEETHLRADVAVVESWRSGISPQWQPEADQAVGVAAAPQLIMVDETTERWLEITDKNGRLITVIEVLSPSNKGSDNAAYRARRDAYINSRVSLVEIDLLRGGAHTVAVPAHQVRRPAGAHYLACVTRASFVTRREVYVMPLQAPLSAIRIPLRPDDPDVVLELQPLVDRCYRMGRYWNTDHSSLPGPALAPEEASWVSERLQAVNS